MKRVIIFAFLMMGMAFSARAYDFSAVAPSGQTLYYNIVSGHAEVVSKYNGWTGSVWISGDIVIPDTVYYNGYPFVVTVIQNYAFKTQNSITSIVVPNTVTTIKYEAFSGCNNLSMVTLPQSVTIIENNVFPSGAKVVYMGTIAQWVDISFSGANANPTCFSRKLYIEGVEVSELVIPEGVTEIKPYAFFNCSNLKSVTLPSTLITIGQEAFGNCIKLSPITIPSSVINIGSNAFGGVPMISGVNNDYGARCINGYVENGLYFTDNSKATFVGASPYLDSVIIPNTVNEISNRALYGYDHLAYVSIPSSVATIRNNAFGGCSNLRPVLIPNSVTTIEWAAFYDVPMIFYIGIASGRPWNARNINAFEENGLYYTSNVKDTLVYADANMTRAVIPNSVTTVVDNAFASCHNMTSITLGTAITSLCDDAFTGCSADTLYYKAAFLSSFLNSSKKYGLDSVRAVVFSGPIVIFPEYLIRGNSRLTYVELGNSVTSIGDYTFQNCSNLASVAIPNSVTSIGNYAFHNCSSLASVSIPNSVTSIGNSTFSGCSNLTSVTMPNSVTSIGNYAFQNCSNLTSVSMPNSVTSIGNYAFYNCSSLASVTIPNSVTSIGYSAFLNCSSLRRVSLGRAITSIGSNAFKNTAIDTLYYNIDSICNFTSSSRPAWDSVRVAFVGNSVHYWPDYLFRNCRKLETITIGDSVGYIRDDAFDGCSNLAAVSIGNSVTSIGGFAFSGCSNLTSVSMPNSVTSIGDGAFCNCSSLASVAIPNSVTSIGYSAFYNCSSLASVAIPNSVTSIGYSAFYNCSSLRRVSLGRAITSIGSNAFKNTAIDTLYYNIDSISNFTSSSRPAWDSVRVAYIGNDVRYWPDYLFSQCRKLEYVYIGDSIDFFGNYAFQNCSSLATITIPKRVTSIGNYAFNGCATLDTVYMMSLTHPTLGNSVFPTNNTDLVFMLQGCAYNDYYTTNSGNKWYNYRNKLRDQALGINLTVSSSDYVRGSANAISQRNRQVQCDSTVIIQATANNGFIFDRWSYGSTTNPDTISLLGDSNVIAYFFSFSVTSSNSSRGSASHSSVGDHLEKITATANANYHFDHWSNGSTANPDTITLTSDSSLTAYFVGLTVSSSDNTRGAVSRVKIGDHLEKITATANANYHFDHWSNGSTANPDTITLTSDSSLTAYFVGLTVASSDNTRGSASRIKIGDHLEKITATATSDYHFDHWSNGSTANPDTITLTSDSSLTAYFIGLTIYTSDNTRGSASRVKIGDHLERITATTNYGYHFDHWSNGSTANPDTITLVGDSTLTAYFMPNQYTLTLAANDPALGTVTGNGLYDYLQTVTITAACTAEHHHFVRWNDGVTANTRNVTITKDSMFTAIFAIDTHFVNVLVNNDSYGYVTGTGYYPYGSTATIEAMPYEGHLLIGWSGGIYENPYSFNVQGDAIYQAQFTDYCTPSLCMVSVQNNHNVVIWDNDGVDASYNIYREGITTGDYDLVATVPHNEGFNWMDEESRPMTRSYRYKMTAVDNYGNETPFSDVHKTMHLTISQGIGNSWNLVWTEYEGANYSSYQIYRGTSYDNVELIDQIPAGGNTTYTDPDVDLSTVYYQVAIVKDEPCYTAKSSNIIRSNIATNGTIGIQTVVTNNTSVEVYPNPAKDKVMVMSDKHIVKVKVMDISGRTVQTFFGDSNVLQIPLTDISSGTYMLQVITSEGVSVKKLIVK